MTSHGIPRAVGVIIISITILSINILPGEARTVPAAFGGEDAIIVASPDTIGICEAIVIPQGYNCQEFEVKTEDGYILSMQRIPHGRRAAGGGGRPTKPVLLQHGILMDGMTWLLNSPEESLAFILADSGYDVWIANTRGTRWSSRHVSLDSSKRAYWAWSWDELVTYDLPATVDFVYQQTGQKMDYVGHSLGTLTALASFSEGRMVDKLKSAALLCPVAYLSHMSTAIGILAAKAFLGEFITNLLGVAEFNVKGKIVADFLNTLCHSPGMDCYNLMTSFTGNNCCLNASTVDLFLKYEPQPTSTRTMVHLAQTYRDGVLTKYNYGNKNVNIEKYGQNDPPVYNMQDIPNDFPLFLSYGGHDSLSDVQDVDQLLDDLKFHNGDKLTVQFVKDYAHADFVMGVSAKEIVYVEYVEDLSTSTRTRHDWKSPLEVDSRRRSKVETGKLSGGRKSGKWPKVGARKSGTTVESRGPKVEHRWSTFGGAVDWIL